MADRPKPKPASQKGRNPDRRNGKAPKKNPGPAATPARVLTNAELERKRQREAAKASARAARAKEAKRLAHQARQARMRQEAAEQAEKDRKAREREARLVRERDSEAARRIARATINRA